MTRPQIIPATRPKPAARLLKRWPWLLGLIATLTVGVGTGAVIGMSQVPADNNPRVLAALDDIGQLKTTQSQRAAERERAIDERSSALDEREADVDAQVAEFDEREGKLDERKTALDERESALDKREKAIKSEERQVKANTSQGMACSSSVRTSRPARIGRPGLLRAAAAAATTPSRAGPDRTPTSSTTTSPKGRQP